MIDLLPTDVKKSRTYGRRNGQLLRWNFMCLLGILGILIIVGTGYFFVDNATLSAAKVKQQTEESIKTAKLDEAEVEYATFSNNLKTVVQILSSQVLFSELLQQIGGVTPNGATLNSVSLADTDNALDLSFTTSSAGLAPTIQVNLEDPENELFEKADIIQVSCQVDEDGDEECGVQLRALFKTDAKFLFLNSVEPEVSP
ncbi:MAG: hypothetical protein AAB624_01475 [Patescibacteria group bacterium]